MFAFSVTVNAKSFMASNFIVKANEWYVVNLSTFSFANSVNPCCDLNFSKINNDLDRKLLAHNSICQININNVNIPQNNSENDSQSDQISGQFENYFQKKYSPQKDHESKWYRGLGKFVGSLWGGIGTL